jgi:hypothetical protein
MGYLDDFRAIYFDPLYVNAWAQNSSLSALYQQDTQLKIDELSGDIEELRSRLTDIQQFQRGELGSRPSAAQDSGTSSAQYNGSALTEVVSLAERAALSDYVEYTLDIRRELIAERAALQTKLRRMQNATANDTALSEDFLQTAEARYTDVVAAYSALIDAARDILIAETPSYFSPISQPFSSEPPLYTRRDILFIALALALGATLAMIAALIWPQKYD